MSIFPVSSIVDPRLDDYRHVRDPELNRLRGLFIAEGRLVVRRLIEGTRFGVRSLLVTSAALDGLSDVLAHVSAPVFVVDEQAMHAVAGFNFHRGCLAVGIRQAPETWRDVVVNARVAVVLEQITNADNMGGIFRTAAAFAANTVVIDPSSVDPLYRKAIRTSMGATLRLPFATMRNWPDDLVELRALGFTLAALTPSPDAPALSTAVDALRGLRVALLLGHEGSGLSDRALEQAQVLVRIPMPGGTDSLNVVTAAAIALYELTRSASGSRL